MEISLPVILCMIFLIFPTSQLAEYAYLPQLAANSCKLDKECDTVKGLICTWDRSRGCGRGICRCEPGKFRDTAAQHCRSRKKGGESCSPSDACIRGMRCNSGLCSCRASQRLSEDSLRCLEREDRLIGDVCDRHSRCLSKGDHAYSTEKATCHMGRCRCKDKFIRDGYKCRKYDLYERGCRIDDTCRGGALCQYRRCQCPGNYIPSNGDNILCIPPKAQTTLRLGDICDPTGKRKICTSGLQCFGCVSRVSRCVRAFDGFDFNVSIRMHHHRSIFLLISCLVLLFVIR